MKSMTPEKAGRDKSQYRQTLKGLRAAEARLRFELLQEQRLLQNHVADFWDASLDRHSGNVAGRRKSVQLATERLERLHQRGEQL